jgi:transposase
MLVDESWRFRMNENDLAVFRALLPKSHPLIDSLELIPWDRLSAEVKKYYVADMGQPAIPPLLMLKLEFLSYKYHLSDIQVVERARTDVLFRWFLQIPMSFQIPHSSTLCRFRGRLTSQGMKDVFNRLVGFARDVGLVKDRLRLKDASHVIANIAVPTTVQLLSQLRSRLLDSLAKFDFELANGFLIRADQIREQTRGHDAAGQLEPRVALVQDILAALQTLVPPQDAETNRDWQQLEHCRQLAEKILNDQANPGAGHRTISLVDEDARQGKHGKWYDGYMVDVLMDGDSEVITTLDVLEAGGNEAKSAVALVVSEQQTHGNQIEKISIDGAGYNGEMLRQFETPVDSGGLGVEVFVPPKSQPDSDLFPASSFEISESGDSVICPAGQTSRYRQKRESHNGTMFRFKRSQCDGCPLVAQCVNKPQTGAFGRTVTKNDYEQEYERARAKAKTEQYAATRKEHPAIERKLQELLNHQCGRYARYWGREKVLFQELLAGFTTNIKRIAKLLRAQSCAVCD